MSQRKNHSPAAPMLSGEHRLNKILAAAGLGSRRQCEELIEQERVEVDGQVVKSLSQKVDPAAAKIIVDGVNLRQHKPVYFAVNKPAGVLCTNRDPQGRPRVIDLVPGQSRLFPVGRLDSSSIGLILLTNDGELAQRLAHPSYGVAKTYFVVVQGQVQPQDLVKLRKGIYLAEGVARVEGAKIRRVRRGSTELEIILTEGKNREIRRVLARFGHKVVVLRRLAIGPLRLGTMPEGMHRPLTSGEVAALYRAADEAKLAKTKPKIKTTIEKPTDLDKSAVPGKSSLIGKAKKIKTESDPTKSPSKVSPSKVSSGSSSKVSSSKVTDSDGPHLGEASMIEIRPPQLDGHDMDAPFSRRHGGVIADEDDDAIEMLDSESLDDDVLEEELLDDYDSDDESEVTEPKSRSPKQGPTVFTPRIKGKKPAFKGESSTSRQESTKTNRRKSDQESSSKKRVLSRSEAMRQISAPRSEKRSGGTNAPERTSTKSRSSSKTRSASSDRPASANRSSTTSRPGSSGRSGSTGRPSSSARSGSAGRPTSTSRPASAGRSGSTGRPGSKPRFASKARPASKAKAISPTAKSRSVVPVFSRSKKTSAPKSNNPTNAGRVRSNRTKTAKPTRGGKGRVR